MAGRTKASSASRNGTGPVPATLSPLDSLDSRIADLAAPFQQELEQVEAHRRFMVEKHEEEIKRIERAHKASLKQVDDTITRVRGVLTALGIKSAAKPKPKATAPEKHNRGQRLGQTRSNGTPTGFGITAETAAVCAEAIKEVAARKEAAGEEPTFTQKEIYRQALNWDQSKASQAFRFLRSIEFLRKAGRMSGSNTSELWAIMDPEAMDRVLNDVRSQEQDRRNALLHGSVDDEDRNIRAAAYIREHDVVVGWTELCEALDIPDAQIDSVRTALLEAGVIKTTVKRGAKTIIEWNGEGEV